MSGTSLLLAFYGDDFTGSTDAMEALTINGFRTLLFVEPPSKELLHQFRGIQCIGVAGTGRAKAPSEMEEELRPVFESFANLPVSLVHYKVCSTFDSSPTVGSIGKAIDIARDYFGKQGVIPLLAGAPPLGRYTVFGQHFAKMYDKVYRLDRHPTMAHHPSTPMDEADLRVHLSKQTEEEISLFDITEMNGGKNEVLNCFNKKYKEFNGVVLIDILHNEQLMLCGDLIINGASKEQEQRFIVGSSGVEYALGKYWRQDESNLSDVDIEGKEIKSTKNILVVSGSGSPITKVQIENALENGFHGIRVNSENLIDQGSAESLISEAISKLRSGESVIVYTALGPKDEEIAKTNELLITRGIEEKGKYIGECLGSLTRSILNEVMLSRIVVAGGDTSGYVSKEIGIYALEVAMPLSPGAPLCIGYSENKDLDGIEIALKGGQLGSEHYFTDVLHAEK